MLHVKALEFEVNTRFLQLAVDGSLRKEFGVEDGHFQILSMQVNLFCLKFTYAKVTFLSQWNALVLDFAPHGLHGCLGRLVELWFSQPDWVDSGVSGRVVLETHEVVFSDLVKMQIISC